MDASAARGDSQRFRFAYRAPSGCPDERTFVERVAARIDSARLASSDDTRAAMMSIDVTVRETESSGRLEFVEATGETVVRTVGGRTCDEIVSGLALIAALAIEARTMTEPAVEAPVAPPVAPNRSFVDASHEESSASGAPVQFGDGVSGGVDSSSTPGAALAAGLHGEIAWRPPLRFVRVGARRVAREGSVNDRSASFTRWAARFEGCPISFELVPRLELPVCAAFELGQLTGAGRAGAALPNPESANILWASLDASGGFRWKPDRWWVVEARGAVDFPLTRHKFVFKGPDDLIFDVPALGWGVAIDVGAHFP